MNAVANRDLVNRMIEEIQNRKNLELVEEIFAERFVNRSAARGVSPDRSGMRELFAMIHVAFPDGRLVVEDQTVGNDKVWTRKAFSGTHTGPLGSLAPTGNRVTYTVFDILRVEGGQLVEHWGLVDRYALLGQVGAIKS